MRFRRHPARKRDSSLTLLLSRYSPFVFGALFLLFLVYNAQQQVALHISKKRILYEAMTTTRTGIPPRVYDNVDSMPPMVSSGPDNVHPGMLRFHNVCITSNVDAAKKVGEKLHHGIMYFALNNSMHGNELRCVPCSHPIFVEHWNDIDRDDATVGHRCGLYSQHAMYATSVSDWNTCMATPKAKEYSDLWEQNQSPSHANVVHYYDEPTFLLQYMENNPGHSLFDMLLSFLPYWHNVLRNKDDKQEIPFTQVMAHQDPQCLTTSKVWLCVVLRAIKAFSGANVLPPEPTPDTLYCFRTLYATQMAWNRNVNRPEALPKNIMDDFRADVLRGMDLTASAAVSNNKEQRQHVLFYAHKPSGRRVWLNMDELVDKMRVKFPSLLLETVEDFGAISVAQQAKKFHTADMMIMVHGAQMANSLFSRDGRQFVELGCAIYAYIGNPNYMDLIGGSYLAVQKCPQDNKDEELLCVMCPAESENPNYQYSNFTMNEAALAKILQRLVEKE